MKRQGVGAGGGDANIRLSAIRKLATEAVDNGLMPRDLAAGIARAKVAGLLCRA